MSKSIESRIVALEAAKNAQTKGHRPFPLSYFYGEPLPADFHTSDKYIQRGFLTLEDFYAQDPDRQS
ncbi:MAG: hypothetical protein ACYCY1_11480 [Sulfuriferula sp.]